MIEARDIIDPYLEWAVATKFAYLDGEWFPVLIEVEQPAVDTIARDFHPEIIRIPWIYQAAQLTTDGRSAFWTAIMHRSALTALVEGKSAGDIEERLRPLLKWIRRLELGSPVVSAFAAPKPLAAQPKPLSALPPRRAIVAVIDDGLAFAHHRFRFATGATRFKYFWNQDDAAFDRAPPDFGWGSELAEREINALLTSSTHSGMIDDDEVYRKAGQQLVGRRVGHGTHVMDIACGCDPREADDLSPSLIGVQLPRWVTKETSGGLLTPVVHAALSYILSRADQIAIDENTAAPPVVVNLSYGTIAGPHDGSSSLERAIDQMIAARSAPLRVVLPAGNHYMARCHAHLELPAAASDDAAKRLHWRAPPDNQSAAFVEIRLPESADVAVRITPPTGEAASPWIEAGGQWSLLAPDGHVRFRAHSVRPAGQRPWILLAMAPTTRIEDNLTAPSGTWLIEISNKGAAIAADAWVQRGDTPFGYPLRGRQSRFEEHDYLRFDPAGRPEQNDRSTSPVRRQNTVNALATGQAAIVVGGFRRSDRRPDLNSGAGPAAKPAGPPLRSGPDAAAVSDDSVTLHGVLAAGTRTGSVVAMRGTSVAAPQVTRLIADLMTAQASCDRRAMQDVAARGPRPAPPSPTPTPGLTERIGAGLVEIRSASSRWTRW